MKEVLIHHFSGTGNSFHATRQIAVKIQQNGYHIFPNLKFCSVSFFQN